MTTALLIVGTALAALICAVFTALLGYCAAVWTLRRIRGLPKTGRPALFCWLMFALFGGLLFQCLDAIRGAVG